ncbi:hypothetical protein BN1221_02220c [Brenneria goodwinii]|uniref:Uncharacterized protein n=1 Tax=Brenneria goodwinii TaxID=1109412 RepID=A0A0G4JUZ1_9GAMM|nr:hypothetical protein BN1221_02220c [Brenneria goodwinii]
MVIICICIKDNEPCGGKINEQNREWRAAIEPLRVERMLRGSMEMAALRRIKM